MKKLMFGLILGLLLSLMCLPAFADIWINGTMISGDYNSDDGTVVYDADHRTLTLNNFNSSGYYDPIFANGGEIREIVLIGDSTITAAEPSYGVTIDNGPLRISGSGSLTVKSYFAPLYVPDGVVTIDGAAVTLTNTSGIQEALFAKNRLDLVNGAKLSASSDCYWGTLHIYNDNDPSEGIRVSGGSTLEVYGSEGGGRNPFEGSLVVSDTSCAIVVSGDFCTPASFDGTADSVTLKPVLLPDALDYGDEWKLIPGNASGRYAFTVKQTQLVDDYSVLYRVEIQGAAHSGLPPALPATGDSTPVMLLVALLLMGMTGMAIICRRHAA